MTPAQLENRLVEYASLVLDVINGLPNDLIGKSLANQMVRSCISPALNYAEAQSAESKRDFVHKMNICLKELRETIVAMKIIRKRELVRDTALLDRAIGENSELIAMFTAAIKTTKSKFLS